MPKPVKKHLILWDYQEKWLNKVVFENEQKDIRTSDSKIVREALDDKMKKYDKPTNRMNCACSTCQVYPDPWIVYMQEMIRDGHVVHIGFDDRNRPLFRVVD